MITDVLYCIRVYIAAFLDKNPDAHTLQNVYISLIPLVAQSEINS